MNAEWAVVNHLPRFDDSQVHVWFAELDLENLDRFEPDLSAEEIARGDRFLDSQSRRAYIWSHGLLRQLIAAYRGVPPRDVTIFTTLRGKPVLPNTDFHFSLSHSGKAALFAFALNTELGIDIECIDSNTVDFAVAERVLTPEELHALTAYEDLERLPAFLRGWTRKEAYVKCCGTSIDDMTRVHIGLSEGVASVGGIFIRSFRCTEDLIGSLATRGEPNSVAFLRWSPHWL